MKKILCPVDFSPAANNAVEYAANLAKHLQGELVLLHVLEVPALQDVANLSAGFPATMEEREQRLEDKLNAYATEVINRFSIPCKAVVNVHKTNINAALKKEAQSSDYDLIVMGTNGADDLLQFYFGTHTYSMIRNTGRALLMVPEQSAFRKPEHIVYAAGYDSCDTKAVRHVFELCKVFNPGVTVLHVSEKPSSVSEDVYKCLRDVMEDEVDNPRLQFKRVVESDVAAALDNYMRQNNQDLLVLLTGQYTLADKVFHESVTRKLSSLATYPMLVVHPEK